MDGLRWLLLLVGLFVIAGVYFYSRKEREQIQGEVDEPASDNSDRRLEPSLNGDSAAADFPEPDEDEASSKLMLGDEDKTEPAVAELKQKVVTLRIVAPGEKQFAGDELVLSLRGIGMRHGKFGIFHRFESTDDSRIVFSVASLVEPGSFDLTNLKEQKIPGISLFMVLPGPIDGTEAFDLMMVAARALALSLKAEMLDESGSTLSIQRERYMREEIIEYQTANRVA